MNDVTIHVSRLPPDLRTTAELWWAAGWQVAARLDDAGEYRIMKLRPGESPWVGWFLVRFGA